MKLEITLCDLKLEMPIWHFKLAHSSLGYEQLCKLARIAYIFKMPKQSLITTTEITYLVQQIREIVLFARAHAARSIDNVQVAMNFTIGQRIVEHEQGGDRRAA